MSNKLISPSRVVIPSEKPNPAPVTFDQRAVSPPFDPNNPGDPYAPYDQNENISPPKVPLVPQPAVDPSKTVNPQPAVDPSKTVNTQPAVDPSKTGN